MRKVIYAVMLLLGLSMMASSCEGSGRSNSNSSSSNSKYQQEEDVDPYDLYSDWSECIDLQIQEIQVGMMTGPGIVVENICAHKIKQVQIVAQSGFYSENNPAKLRPNHCNCQMRQLQILRLNSNKLKT